MDNVPAQIKNYLIKEGTVLNPNGKPKGSRSARTIVREFMDHPCDKLPTGLRVTRFQYLLWSMYEMSYRLHKQVDYRKSEVKKAEAYLTEAKEKLDEFLAKDDINNEKEFNKLDKKLTLREREFRSRNREYEFLIGKVQEADARLSDFFQKASGQYIDTKEIINSQPVNVTADKKDLDDAIEVIADEL